MTLDDTAIEEIIAALARAKLRQEGSSPSTATRPSSSTPAQDTSTTPKVKLTFIYQEPDVPSISANLHIPDQHVELVSDEVPSSGMSLEALCDEKICAMVCEQEAYEKNTFDTDKLDLKYYKCDVMGVLGEEALTPHQVLDIIEADGEGEMQYFKVIGMYKREPVHMIKVLCVWYDALDQKHRARDGVELGWAQLRHAHVQADFKILRSDVVGFATDRQRTEHGKDVTGRKLSGEIFWSNETGERLEPAAFRNTSHLNKLKPAVFTDETPKVQYLLVKVGWVGR